MGSRILFISLAVLMLSQACTQPTEQKSSSPQTTREEASLDMDQLAESYVRAVLALGLHDADYVDAYYGPSEWRSEAETAKADLDTIRKKVQKMAKQLATPVFNEDPMLAARHLFLSKQVRAMLGRLDMLSGKQLSFDEESNVLYDASPPTFDEAHFQALLGELEALIPGDQPINERIATYRNQFVIPPDKIDEVFKTAIEEAKKRTRIPLPAEESFVLEYVTDKPWSGYNWYKGNFHSLIQVNTDLPISIERAIDLACHEGYPGHHVFNVLIEKHLVRERGWVEYSVYPLFSPVSLIAEGSANYGIEVAFPQAQRIAYYEKVLFPLAGIDPSKATEFDRVNTITDRLRYAGNEAARNLLNEKWDEEQAVAWMVRYGLRSEESARQRISFIRKYRSYVINYNYGEDLVKTFVTQAMGEDTSDDRRWSVFADLLARPRVPSSIKQP